MGDFHGFDTAKIRTMAGDMKNAGPGARTLHGELASVLRDAQALLKGAQPASKSPVLEALIPQVLPLLYAGLPASLHAELDTTADSIRRRCAQLDRVHTLEEQGYSIDPGLDFDDEKAPDKKNIDDALAYFDDHIDDSGGFLWENSAQGAKEVLKRFSSLTPTELDAVMSRMSVDQLKKLNAQVGEGSTFWGAGDSDGTVKAQWVNLLTSELGPTTLARMQSTLTHLPWQPNLHTDYVKNLKYQAIDGTLYGPSGDIDLPKDMSQGDDGDCWFLASLAAVSARDPGFVRDHIKVNPNGTYTVTLYRAPVPNIDGLTGQPVEVTVDNQLPVDHSGKPVYAPTPDNVMWVAIYEKAYAQFSGGYQNISGGLGDQGMHEITGLPTTLTTPGSMSLADMNQKIKEGHAVTVDSVPHLNSVDDRLVGEHEYSVQSVNTEAHPPTITLFNPWGRNSEKMNPPVPATVTVTESQYQQYFREVSSTKTRA
ncbi:Calpain family cysteine protease [Actinacidiphila yanglinensis]|uniref:Calpain family cysteine protease n=1 Tax=Actinacidiphila yanglinensis TaxID=310779 RepID=A0A1H6E9V6_9ACTN|nr:C2 family cysteine protease [Actinacidiphila yanglinensis]SEG94051.1 Calpain family cysteine protease [Actinacidiphila yanglinensis]